MLFGKYRYNDKEPEDAFDPSEFELDLSEPVRDPADPVFLNSVEELTEEDIPCTVVRSEKRTVSDILRTAFLCLFAATFLVSCGLLVKNAITKYRSSMIYKELEATFFSQGFQFDPEAYDGYDGSEHYLSADGDHAALPTLSEQADRLDTGTATEKNYNEDLQKMRAGLASLEQINPDIYGWITVEGTQINYPIVRGEDNDYYLNHAYTGDYLPEGSIFADYRNSSTVTDNPNTVLYGHNLTSGGMFHDVTKFANADFMKSSLIYVYTFDGVFIFEPFSFYETPANYNYFKTKFSSNRAFVSFAKEMLGNSAVIVEGKEFTFSADDRLLTLSTCTNGYYNQRYALHARLIQVITDKS